MLTKWDEFLRKVFPWRTRHRKDQLIKVNKVREKSINLLQKRYGYSREKAIEELDTRYSGTWLG